MIWKGDAESSAIVRTVYCTPVAEQAGLCWIKCPPEVPNCQTMYEEALRTNHSTFNRFRCMIDTDMNRVIDMALKSCKERP